MLDLDNPKIRTVTLENEIYYSIEDVLTLNNMKYPEKKSDQLFNQVHDLRIFRDIQKGEEIDYANESNIKKIVEHLAPRELSVFDKTLEALMKVPKPEK